MSCYSIWHARVSIAEHLTPEEREQLAGLSSQLVSQGERVRPHGGEPMSCYSIWHARVSIAEYLTPEEREQLAGLSSQLVSVARLRTRPIPRLLRAARRRRRHAPLTGKGARRAPPDDPDLPSPTPDGAAT